MDDTLWNLRGVSLGKRLTGLTLRVPQGVTAVLGASGAGKTSLLNLLVGFECPDAGTIESAIRAPAGRLPVFWAPSNAGLWPHLTVARHLHVVAPQSGAAVEAGRLLDEFGLSHRSDARPGDLSMGERSRLAVARALAACPAVLVMDEPLAHVGQAQSLAGWRAIRRHVESTAASLVFATHSPETVMAEASHVICLRDGTLIYEGPVRELYSAPRSREAAECLGLANWFEHEDATLWLGDGASAPFCVRPEQLLADPDTSSPCRVESVRFRGASQTLDLRHERTGATRSFLCRNNGTPLAVGAGVRLSRANGGPTA